MEWIWRLPLRTFMNIGSCIGISSRYVHFSDSKRDHILFADGLPHITFSRLHRFRTILGLIFVVTSKYLTLDWPKKCHNQFRTTWMKPIISPRRGLPDTWPPKLAWGNPTIKLAIFIVLPWSFGKCWPCAGHIPKKIRYPCWKKMFGLLTDRK